MFIFKWIYIGDGFSCIVCFNDELFLFTNNFDYGCEQTKTNESLLCRRKVKDKINLYWRYSSFHFQPKRYVKHEKLSFTIQLTFLCFNNFSSNVCIDHFVAIENKIESIFLAKMYRSYQERVAIKQLKLDWNISKNGIKDAHFQIKNLSTFCSTLR